MTSIIKTGLVSGNRVCILMCSIVSISWMVLDLELGISPQLMSYPCNKMHSRIFSQLRFGIIAV